MHSPIQLYVPFELFNRNLIECSECKTKINKLNTKKKTETKTIRTEIRRQAGNGIRFETVHGI